MTQRLPVPADHGRTDAALALLPILFTASADLITARDGSDARAMHQRYYETSQKLTHSIALASRISPDAARELVRVIATLLRTGRDEPDESKQAVMSRAQGEDAHRALGALINALQEPTDVAVAIEHGKKLDANEGVA